MINIVKYFVFPFGIVALLIFAGCESNLSLHYPDHEPELAVICFFNPDEPWTVIVRDTYSLGDSVAVDFSREISNARVEIWEGDQLIATPGYKKDGERDPGVYVVDSLDRHAYPVPQVAYTLKVSVAGYPLVEATEQIPASMGAPQVVFIDSAGVDEETKNVQAALRITFSDEGESANFYAIEAKADFGAGLRETDYTTNDPVLNSTPFVNIFGKANKEATVFDDATFNGNAFEASIMVDRNLADAYQANVLHVSEAYYRYALSLAQIEAIGDNPFAEPARPYSNMRNGQGIFAGFLRHQTPPIELSEINLASIAGQYRSFFFYNVGDTLGVGSVHPDSMLFNFFPDGRVSGRLNLMASISFDDLEGDVPLEGTFSYEKPYVKMNLSPQTFLNDAVWRYDLNTMRPIDTNAKYYVFFNRK